jgi:hypothetical protein
VAWELYIEALNYRLKNRSTYLFVLRTYNIPKN